MLINVSNHPVSEWSIEQQTTAEQTWGTIVDLGFPQIDPMATTAQVQKVAKVWFDMTLNQKPAAVHIMGEHTFVLALVNLLQDAGINCVASTTNRLARQLEDGSWQRTFQFCAFREYPQ
jgi:hypothetical protein